MRRQRTVGRRANLELGGREVARLRSQMHRGIALSVTLFAVALRTVLEIQLLAGFPLRVGADVRSRRTPVSRQRGAPERNHESYERTRLAREKGYQASG